MIGDPYPYRHIYESFIAGKVLPPLMDFQREIIEQIAGTYFAKVVQPTLLPEFLKAIGEEHLLLKWERSPKGV